MEKVNKEHYFGLNILRLFAALWVVSFHYFLGLSADLSWYRYGNLGVPLFFIISGFVISQSVSTNALKHFFLNRFLRLFPLFWILCTFTYLFTQLMPNGNPVSFAEYLISMTMLGEKFGNLLGYTRLVDAVYWSLVVELIFYTGIGLFVHFFSWKNIRLFTFSWLCISIASFYIGANETFIAKTLLVRHASYFLFGITLSLIVQKMHSSKKEKYYDYFFLLVTAVYSTFISAKALPGYLVPNPSDTLIVMMLHPFFFISVMMLIFFSFEIKSPTWLKISAIIGGITYPLYLVHQTVGNTLIAYFENFGTLASRGTIMIIVAISFSYIAYHLDSKLRGAIKKRIGHLFEERK